MTFLQSSPYSTGQLLSSDQCFFMPNTRFTGRCELPCPATVFISHVKTFIDSLGTMVKINIPVIHLKVNIFQENRKTNHSQNKYLQSTYLVKNCLIQEYSSGVKQPPTVLKAMCTEKRGKSNKAILTKIQKGKTPESKSTFKVSKRPEDLAEDATKTAGIQSNNSIMSVNHRKGPCTLLE